MSEPIRNPIEASLSFSGIVHRTLQYRIRARFSLLDAHIIIVGTFLRFIREPDQLIRFSPTASLTQLAPDTFEEELPEDKSRLITMRNQTALISYDLATNTREVSQSYDR
jgi:hypothetical protein